MGIEFYIIRTTVLVDHNDPVSGEPVKKGDIYEGVVQMELERAAQACRNLNDRADGKRKSEPRKVF